MQNKPSYFTAQRLAAFGVMSALVFVSSWMQIPIGDVTRVHLGNGFCALTGLLFGPALGGFASGVGSMLFDFTNPLYIAESWLTFILKFFIGFLAGAISHYHTAQKGFSKAKDILGAAVGAAAYVVLYLGKTLVIKLWIEHQALGAVQAQLVTKLAASSINAVAAVIVSVLLASALRPALSRAGLFGGLAGPHPQAKNA